VRVALLLLLTLSASPVDDARGHLKAGKLDDVLFDLDGKKLSGDEAKAGAAVLGEAAQASFKQKDFIMALQFSQMALKWNAQDANALEAGARAAKASQQFGTAEKLCDRWLLLDAKNPPARLLRAELAVAAGEWKLALSHLAAAKPTKDLETQWNALQAQAQQELDERQSALSTVALLEKELKRAQEDAARHPSKYRAADDRALRSGSAKVVLYSTSWCGYCKKAREYFTRKGIPFVEKDIEKDQAAARELADKAMRAGVAPQGVPVIDVKGKLIMGFNVPAIEAAL